MLEADSVCFHLIFVESVIVIKPIKKVQFKLFVTENLIGVTIVEGPETDCLSVHARTHICF